MTRRMLLTIVAAALVALAAGQTAGAQTRFDFKIPTGFVANGKAFPSGNYALSVDEGSAVVTLESTGAKMPSVVLPVETRVSEPKPLAEPEVVFDKLNGQLLLSELLVPGEDGYLLLVTKAKHTHELLKGARAKK
jgi:hypothetical protein